MPATKFIKPAMTRESHVESRRAAVRLAQATDDTVLLSGSHVFTEAPQDVVPGVSWLDAELLRLLRRAEGGWLLGLKGGATMRKAFAAMLLLSNVLLAAPLDAQTIWYVDQHATGTNDGTSWRDAFNDLQDALDVATDGAEIRVAQGTYGPSKPTISDIPESASFDLVNGCALLGGYAGAGEPDPDLRDVVAFETVLSGSASVAGWSWGVVTAGGVSASTVIDGLTIRDGMAGPLSTLGGGLRISNSSLVVRDCLFTNNQSWWGGGAIGAIGAADWAVTVESCTFEHNWSPEFGPGGAILSSGSLFVRNCSFVNDHSTDAGGAVASFGPLVVQECSFDSDSALGPGGAVFCAGDAAIYDCSFTSTSSGGSVTGPSGASGRGGAIGNAGALQAVRCDFVNNAAAGWGPESYYPGGQGGAVWSVGGSASFSACRFLGNRAMSAEHNGGQGGVLYLAESAAASFSKCLLMGNEAETSDFVPSPPAVGGTIFNAGESASLDDCIVVSNVATSTSDGYFSVLGECGGIYGYSVVNHCVLWGNSDGSGSGEAAQLSGGKEIVNYSCVEGWTGLLGGTGNTGQTPGLRRLQELLEGMIP